MNDLRRATVARTILESISFVCLIASGAFWFSLYYAVLDPPVLASRETVIALSMGLVYTLVLPLLWSILVPSTPAGMLLQKTQHRTWGFGFVIAAALYLTWHGGMLLRIWWLSQPHVAASEQDLFLTISCLIAFVLVPALAWTQVTPERWLAQVQQAHMVKRLEVMQSADIALLKERLLWAQRKAAVGYANLLPAERDEVVRVLRGLFMGINDTQRALAQTLHADSLVEQTMGDREIAERLDYVAQVLESTTVEVPHHLTCGAPIGGPPSIAFVADSNEETNVRTNDLADAFADRQRSVADDLYTHARDALPRAWKRSQLESSLSIEKTKAWDLIRAWKASGLLTELSEPKFHYSFTESER